MKHFAPLLLLALAAPASAAAQDHAQHMPASTPASAPVASSEYALAAV